MAMSKITKSLCCVTCILVLSSSASFAQSIRSEENSSDRNDMHTEATMPKVASTPIDDHGGHGEYGWGLFHAWAKYAHPTNSHRVVLQTDNSYHYGAWEDAGGNNYSYVQAKKGNSTNYAYGEIR